MKDFFKVQFGEMGPYERELLYNYVIKYNPKKVLEIGSGVGASTYYILNALKVNNCENMLYSCDPSRKPIREIFNNFQNLEFHYTKSNVLIDKLIEKNQIPDFLFFDGPEEPEIALQDFKKLEKHVKIGTIFSMHDWCTVKRKLDGATSTKAKLIKPYINSNDDWELIEETDALNYDSDKKSVGLVFYKKIK